MKHSHFLAAARALAESLLGPGSSAQAALLTPPVLSASNPALVFRISLSSPEKTAADILTALAGKVGVTGAVSSPAVVRAVERVLARGMNTCAPFVELGIGMAHIISGTAAESGDAACMIFDFRCQPTRYEPNA